MDALLHGWSKTPVQVTKETRSYSKQIPVKWKQWLITHCNLVKTPVHSNLHHFSPDITCNRCISCYHLVEQQSIVTCSITLHISINNDSKDHWHDIHQAWLPYLGESCRNLLPFPQLLYPLLQPTETREPQISSTHKETIFQVIIWGMNTRYTFKIVNKNEMLHVWCYRMM